MLTRKQWNKHREVIIWFMDQPGGTEVLSKSPENNDKWFLTMDPAWRLNTLYIINDIYSEYRKAIAMGKQVQYYKQLTATWEDLETTNPNISFKEVGYRIKPEEPKFTIGNWVVSILKDESKETWRIQTSSDIELINSSFYKSTKLWMPNNKKYCWFYDSPNKIPRLNQFESEVDGWYFTTSGIRYQYCEPFTGKLPQCILDRC